MAFVKGQSGNPKGRPKGIIDKRQRMQQALGKDADEIIAVIRQKALEGDMQAGALVLARLVPQLKPEGSLVRFELDTTASLPAQIEAVTKAVAAGQLTVEEGQKIADMIEKLANVRAAADGDGKADKLIEAFKKLATSLPV